MSWGDYPRYPKQPTVASRRAKAEKAAARLQKQQPGVEPVVIEGRTIARTFWGKAWCSNLEAYHDYASRLPRGRSYVINRAVIDLTIQPGLIEAQVQGTRRYDVSIAIKPLPAQHWRAFKNGALGKVSSAIALLRGELPDDVLHAIVDKKGGLFPRPDEITLQCSCPDWASMCKHVAATLYGVGNRLDSKPELLFTLREVDPTELVAQVTASAARDGGLVSADPNLATVAADELGDIFGIELDDDGSGGELAATVVVTTKSRASHDATKGAVAKKAGARKAGATKPGATKAGATKAGATAKRPGTKIAGTRKKADGGKKAGTGKRSAGGKKARVGKVIETRRARVKESQ